VAAGHDFRVVTKRPRARQRWSAGIRAFFRLPGTRGFVIALVCFVVVAAAATAIVAWQYRSGGDRLTIGEALYAVLNLLFFNTVYSLPDDALSRVVFFLLPVLGLVVLGQLLVRLGTALLNREQWERALASTYSDHVILCGLGRVGFRVARWLHDLGQPLVVIEVDPANPFLEQVRALGIPVIIADARRPDILRQAAIEHASAVAAVTADDLLNLSVGTEARALQPDIRVVLRTFEDRLAENLRQGFDIHAAYSASALAAPAFAAAATRAPVDHAFAFAAGDQTALITVTKFTLVPESPLVGWTVGRLENELGVNVLAHRTDRFEFHPPDDRVLRANEGMVVSATIDTLNRLARLTPPTRFLKRYEEGRWPLDTAVTQAGHPSG
jgi:Trk K+ transport system NAD-binding subunit